MKCDSYFFSTVGRKQIMAVAGLGLSLFVLAHAAGNMFMFVGPDAYNKYGHALTSNPLIYAAEAGLIAIFLAHIVSGVVLTMRNFQSRPQGYAVTAKGDKSTSLTTKTMWMQGFVILLFVGIHLYTFKYGAHYETEIEGKVVRDLFRLIFEAFQSPIYVTWYVVALLLLCFHLAHGVYSALQTLGLQHPKYTPKIKCVSIGYGVLVAALFIAQPIYMFFFYKG
jgi:succinate dehydrogenase / fumarate reductase cytochrome b subunit